MTAVGSGGYADYDLKCTHKMHIVLIPAKISYCRNGIIGGKQQIL